MAAGREERSGRGRGETEEEGRKMLVDGLLDSVTVSVSVSNDDRETTGVYVCLWESQQGECVSRGGRGMDSSRES